MSAANESEKAPEPAPQAPAAPAAEPAVAAPEAGEEKKDRMAGIKNFTGSTINKFKTMPRRLQLILIVVLIVIIAGLAVAISLSGGDDGSGGSSVTDPDTLEEFSLESGPVDCPRLAEGTQNAPNSVEHTLADLIPFETNATYFIKEITATLTWTDEPDMRQLGRTRYNHPDNFQLEINGSGNASKMSTVTPNDMGSKQGNIPAITLSASDMGLRYFYMGNASDLRLPDDVRMGSASIFVHLYEAEDYIADGPHALIWIDDGNSYTLSVTVKGTKLAAE